LHPALPFQQIDFIDIDGFFIAENGNDDGETDGDFGGGDGHNKEDEDLAVDEADEFGDSDEAQIDGIEHQFNGHKDDDGVFAGKHADDAEGKKHRR